MGESEKKQGSSGRRRFRSEVQLVRNSKGRGREEAAVLSRGAAAVAWGKKRAAERRWRRSSGGVGKEE